MIISRRKNGSCTAVWNPFWRRTLCFACRKSVTKQIHCWYSWHWNYTSWKGVTFWTSSSMWVDDCSCSENQSKDSSGRTRNKSWTVGNRVRRPSGFPTFISCQRQDANVLPKRRQSHQGDKLCDVSTVPLVARWPVFLAGGSDADGEPH